MRISLRDKKNHTCHDILVMSKTNQLSALLDKLIKDAENILKKGAWSRGAVLKMVEGGETLMRWSNELILFTSIAGNLVKPWRHNLQHDGRVLVADNLMKVLAALKTIKSAMDEGLLVRFEDLVFAEAFADLTEQAKYLLSQGYFLAAGVILRAVLEEKLRKLCLRHSCFPKKTNPTINDLNQALYTASPPVYDKTVMLHVTSLAGVGNDAAHNNPALKKEDVERFARDLPTFLANFAS